MFKVIIYNIISELGLAVLFDNLAKNISLKKLNKGDFYKKITLRMAGSPNPDAQLQHYYDCTISDVYNGKFAGNSITLFNFTDRTGDMIMSCDLYTSDFI